MTTYYTYKADVPLLPGQTLAFTAGKGYYAAGTPTVSPGANAAQVAKETAGFNEGQVAAVTAQTQPAAANAAQVAKETAGFNEGQVAAATAQTQSAPANAAQVAKETTGFTEGQVAAATAQTQPAPATASQVAKNIAAEANVVQPKPAAQVTSVSPFAGQVAKNIAAEANVVQPEPAFYTYRDEVPLEAGQTIAFTQGRGYYAAGEPGRSPSGAALSATQPSPAKSQTPSRFEQAVTRRPPSPRHPDERPPAMQAYAHDIPLVADKRTLPVAAARPVDAAHKVSTGAELAYANKYAAKGNPAYRRETGFEITIFGIPIIGGGPGDDCTNFVSQALLAGGWKPDATWNDPTHPAYGPDYSGPVSAPSRAWVNVDAFVDYALSSGRAIWVTRASAQPGDIVVADWSGGRGSEFSPDHLMIVSTKRGDGQMYVDEHSNDRYRFPLFGPKGSETIQGKEPDVTFRYLHPL